MKNIYIPKGETVCYESLETEHLIIKGCVKVTHCISAKTISGDGVVIAQSVHADDIRTREIESGSVICKRLIAHQTQATELIASESAAVSTFLSSQYVKTGKLTVSVSEVDEVDAVEVINLGAKRRSLFGLLLVSELRSLWAKLTAPKSRKNKEKSTAKKHGDDDDHTGGGNGGDAGLRDEIAKTVREVMAEQRASAATVEEPDEDFEQKRILNIFKLLRDQGYTLRIIPGTPEENAPVLDFGTEAFRPKAA